MKTSNGWDVLEVGSSRLHRWVIPGTHAQGSDRALTLREGSVGFLLAHNALWFDECVERLDVGVWDEWGHAVRPVRGQSSGYSEHAGGAASDLNSTRHPRGVPVHRTFTDKQIKVIRHRLEIYSGALEWGGNWPSHPGSTAEPDGMHFQVESGLARAERVARRLANTPRGRRVLAANHGQKAVIFS